MAGFVRAVVDAAHLRAAWIVGGLSVLSARAVMGVVERARPQLLSDQLPIARRLGARATIGLAGLAVSRLPERDTESLWRAGARTSGRLLWVGSVGGAIHDLGEGARERESAGRGRPIVFTAVSLAGLSAWAGRMLTERTCRDRTVAGRAALDPARVTRRDGRHHGARHGPVPGLVTRVWWLDYLGPSVPKQVLARSLNAGIWAVGVSTAYNAGVGCVGRANEKVEPGYAEPPTALLVSGSPHSVAPFADLGQQGRRYVTDALTPR